MKQTFQLIEQTCAKSLKPLCITYIIGFILGTFLLDMDEFLWTILIVIMLAVILIIHDKRMKSIVADGAYQRMRILPIKRYSLLWSELIFVSSSLFMLIVTCYLSWICSMWIFESAYSVNALFFAVINNPLLSVLAPIQIQGFLAMLIVLNMLAMLIVFYTFCSHAWSKTGIALLNLGMGIIAVLCVLQFQNWVMIMMCFLFICMNYYFLAKWLRVRRNA